MTITVIIWGEALHTAKIGLVGCGTISGIYLENITNLFRGIEITGVYDISAENAKNAAKRYHIPTVYGSLEQLLQDAQVDIVLNLTRPTEHYAVTLAAVRAGRHVYTEKPLGVSFAQGQELIQEAERYGVFICGAPDTFLGAALQTCRKLIDDGSIGTPVGASAFFFNRGAESWHPNPAFYYMPGGGPVLDMGPYYITALVHLLGGIQSVAGFSRKSFATRIITSEPLAGQSIDVDVATHTVASLQFESGLPGSMLFSFDMHAAELPHIEIYGSKGTLSVPDPNFFGGDVRLYRPENGEFISMPLVFDYPGNSRGLGVADMATAIHAGREPRASGKLLLHVLEVMDAIISNPDGAPTAIITKLARPEAMEKNELISIL